MAVTMLIGNVHKISASLLAPGYTMASLIANEFAEATGDLHLSALMAVGAVLFVVTLIVNGLARWLVWRVSREAQSLPLRTRRVGQRCLPSRPCAHRRARVS